MTGALDQAQKTPWRYGFLNLMRRVDAQLCDTPAGSIWQPRMEKFRLGQTPTMTFAPREIAQVSWQDGRLHLSLYSLGLWGPNGPLPLHYTELALNRSESRHDPTLVHFSNIFHHRWLTQFWQAWRSAQSAGGGLDKPEHDRFAFISPVSAGRIYGKAPKARCQIMFAWRPPPIWYANRAILTGWPPRWRTISAYLLR